MKKGVAYTSHGESIFGRLTVGDMLFMYENKEGITAVGRVAEPWDGINLGWIDEAIYANETLIYQLKVSWLFKLKSHPISVCEIRDLGFDRLFNRTDLYIHEDLGEALIKTAMERSPTQ